MNHIKPILWILLIPFLLSFTACMHVYTAHGVYYRVHEGDTLAAIATKYRVDLQDLAEINNIDSESKLKSGRSLYIPGVTPGSFEKIIHDEQKKVTRHEKKVAQKEKKEKQSTEPADASKIRVERGRFLWPVKGGEVSSGFGIRHGRRHDGLDIRAPIGTPIYAGADGEVVYAKAMRGYGNLIILKHADNFFTVYSHNSVNLVPANKMVKRGDLIAKVGRTGRATGPHVHFEVREGPKARNPLFYLPKNKDIPDEENNAPLHAAAEPDDAKDNDEKDSEPAKQEVKAAPVKSKTAATKDPKQSTKVAALKPQKKPETQPVKNTGKKESSKKASKVSVKKPAPKATPKEAVKPTPKKEPKKQVTKAKAPTKKTSDKKSTKNSKPVKQAKKPERQT